MGTDPQGYTRIGYSHADRLLTYPRVHNLSAISLPIRLVAHEARRAYEERREWTSTPRPWAAKPSRL